MNWAPGPEICRFFGIVITINYRELPHQRPHFHARYAGSRASIAIDTLEVAFCSSFASEFASRSPL
ncbi:MAG: DUF4160 domain-containing protein [Acidobacteria bacterium]|nr:DUF4160 domain-containing protein [Acidobacteriota bacterium]